MPYNLDIPGWMPEKELQILEGLAQSIPPNGKMLEVGSFLGRSSWCWAKTAPTAKVYCIDIWDPQAHPYHPPAVVAGDKPMENDFGKAEKIEQLYVTEENFRANVADCPNIVPLKGYSPRDFTYWEDKSLDLIFLDGLHHNPGFWDDLNFWFDKLKPGGVFCGDDCARTHPDVIWGVHDFATKHGLPYIVQGRIWMIPVPPFKDINTALFKNR